MPGYQQMGACDCAFVSQILRYVDYVRTTLQEEEEEDDPYAVTRSFFVKHTRIDLQAPYGLS